MIEFLVEFYVSRSDAAGVERAGERARLAADELTLAGTSVRYLRSIFVPEDETCFFLYEAVSADAVRAAQGRAALPTHRISTALESTANGSPDRAPLAAQPPTRC
jgi:hypothetical protein